MILRSSDLPHSATVPCFLINVLDQVILLFFFFVLVVCVGYTEARLMW